VRRLLVAVTGALGLGGLWRRGQPEEPPPAAGDGPDPAEELRARLAESRAADAAGDAPAGSEPSAGQEPEAPDPETRRRDLHERARASIDELR
jgi:hypothetical protein